MKSSVAGRNTTEAEVSGITPNGIWVLVSQKEYFLPHVQFPWFKDAPVSAVLDVRMPHPGHLEWTKLDVDLEVACLENAEYYPVIFDSTVPARSLASVSAGRKLSLLGGSRKGLRPIPRRRTPLARPLSTMPPARRKCPTASPAPNS